MSFSLLDKVNSPSDLKLLSEEDIVPLAKEIREFLVTEVEHSGGHLASNLGVVELTLALHRVFDSPSDRIIFDVGHQSYVHKLLTGRRSDFSTLRTPGGLSGFTVRRESEHDPFGAGHSSTAISASIGFATADLLSENGAHTVCVVGDGAYTGGMTHEALNNCRPDLPIIIVINENGMSISENKGAFASYLSHIRVSESYFTDLGFRYIGKLDGNNYTELENALRMAKEYGKATVIHIKTTKGKGYERAESSPETYHNIVVGESTEDKPLFRTVFCEELIRLANADSRITATTPATGLGTGLSVFGEKYPERYFDVGIAEGHALTFSAGLAAAGMLPFVGLYSTFLQRAYDSVLHDIALQNLPVKIVVDRAGLATADGATHHGIFDVAFLSHVPNLSIFTPVTYKSLISAVKLAKDADHPVVIRYSNERESDLIVESFNGISSDGFIRTDFDEAPEYVFVTYGQIAEKVIEAKNILKEEGIQAGIILLEKLKPYAFVAEEIFPYFAKAKRIVFVEEGIKNGGASEILLRELFRLGLKNTQLDIAAIDDNFASPEERCDLYDFVGLSPTKIAEKMRK